MVILQNFSPRKKKTKELDWKLYKVGCKTDLKQVEETWLLEREHQRDTGKTYKRLDTFIKGLIILHEVKM